MKQTHLIALLFAASLMACSSDDESAGTKEEKRLIYVDVSENPLTDPSAAAKERMTTRIANPTTTATLASFSMNYLQSFQYNFKKRAIAGAPTVGRLAPNMMTKSISMHTRVDHSNTTTAIHTSTSQ